MSRPWLPWLAEARTEATPLAMTVAEWREGAVTIELHSGRVSEQLELF